MTDPEPEPSIAFVDVSDVEYVTEPEVTVKSGRHTVECHKVMCALTHCVLQRAVLS